MNSNQRITQWKKTIHHSRNLNINGKGFHRKAVRGVVTMDSRILLVHSKINGDYKFPGGGIEESESHEAALCREVSEECGLELESVDRCIGTIIEYDRPKKAELDYFRMDSFYYCCSVISPEFGPLHLDRYEEELGFEPVWISVDEAILNNRRLLDSGIGHPRWTVRDTFFLEFLAEMMNSF